MLEVLNLYYQPINSMTYAVTDRYQNGLGVTLGVTANTANAFERSLDVALMRSWPVEKHARTRTR